MGACISRDTAVPVDRRDFIPGYVLKGRAVFRGDPGYDVASYQYATTSYMGDGSMQPAIIVYAKCEEDIIQVINYARSKDIAIAVRTGGHQYCGASSTSGPNIQLDISQAFDDDFEHYKAEDGTDRVRMGVTNSLLKTNAKLGKLGLFVPHGLCENVHVGGHLHSGGYGQLYRAFGLFGDHIRAFDIITADGKKQTVTKESNSDLFFAVLGGSPGAFGVVTHVVIAPHRDEDHPHSRGLLAVYMYDKARLARLLELKVMMTNDPNLPNDFDCVITIASFSQEFLHLYPNMDQHMKARHPEVFDTQDKLLLSMNAIVVFAQWANLGGANQKYDESVKAWFDLLKATAEGINLQKYGGTMLGLPYLDNEKHTPMTKLTKSWVFQTMREYDFPYIKRLYITNEPLDHKWVKDAVDRTDIIQRNVLGQGVKIAAQFQLNGINSQVKANTGNGTSYNFRACTYNFTFDAFYDKHGKEFAKKWQEENDKIFIGPEGSFSKRDIRMFWGSYGNRNLSEVWQCYYETEEKYKKIMAIKEKVDPQKLFSPHDFCIGGAKKVQADNKSFRVMKIKYDDKAMSSKKLGLEIREQEAVATS